MMMIRRRNHPHHHPMSGIIGSELDGAFVDGESSMMGRNNNNNNMIKQSIRKRAIEIFFVVIIVIVLTVISYGKLTTTTNTSSTLESSNSFLMSYYHHPATTSDNKNNDNILQKTYNVSDLCKTTPTTTTTKEETTKYYFECGQVRLFEEYDGIQISIESLILDHESGIGSITATSCRHRHQSGSCNFEQHFNASDILLWIRIKSPEFVLAVSAQQAIIDDDDDDDCHSSWRAEFQIPFITTTTTSYQVDIISLWLNGHPQKNDHYWISDTDREIQRDKTWTGTQYVIPTNGAILYGEYIRDGRWMKCSDWCLIHRQCTHWTLDTTVNGFVTDTKKCKLFSNVTGTIEHKKAQSGYFSSNEKRPTYLGGLSIHSGDLTTKRRCRDMSHVLGSPITLDVVPITNNRHSNNNKLPSELPWCSSSLDSVPDGKAETFREEGFWARSSNVYPNKANDISNCPEACVRNPQGQNTNDTTACTPDDTLQGICSFNDVTPIYSGWHTGAIYTVEPPIKDLAWVERDCRYQLGTGDMFQQCLKDNNFDVIYIQNHDIFGDLLDRWHLGRANEWNRKSWTEEFTYRPGEDWLFPTNANNILPDELYRHWKMLDSINNSTTGKPMKAIVVQHLWSMINSRLYQDHQFDQTSFEKAVNDQILAWKDAVRSSSPEDKNNWLSQDTVFIVILSPIVHEFFGDPQYTYEAIEYFNEIARLLYKAAGWHILDGAAVSRARPDYRLQMSWFNANSHLGEKKSGCGVVYAMANILYNVICGGA